MVSSSDEPIGRGWSDPSDRTDHAGGTDFTEVTDAVRSSEGSFDEPVPLGPLTRRNFCGVQ